MPQGVIDPFEAVQIQKQYPDTAVKQPSGLYNGLLQTADFSKPTDRRPSPRKDPA